MRAATPSGGARLGASSEGAMPTMLVRKRLTLVAITLVAILMGGQAALAGLGQPSPWQVGVLQSPSPVMDNILWFHDVRRYIISGIVGFVVVLLVVVMVRFNARTNPIPSRTPPHPLTDIAWTLIPIVLLMFIAVPSSNLLFFHLNVPPADLTVKAT